jgi:hypothetical protein
MRYRSTSITTLSCSSRSRCDGDHKNAFFTAEAGRPRWQPSSAPHRPDVFVFRGDPLKAPLLARPALPSRRSSGSQEIDLRSPSPAPATAGTLVEIGTAHFGWESAGAFKGIICDDIFSEFESVYRIARDLAKGRSLRRSDRLRNCFGAIAFP